MSRAHFEELRRRFVDIRNALLNGPRFAELELWSVQEHIDGSRATVTMDVNAVFTADRGLTLHGDKHPWAFQVVFARGLGGGWKIDAFEAPPVCGTYIRRC